MSAWEGIILAVVTLGSCFASYRLGQAEMLARFRNYSKRRQERYRRWAEFYDEED